jgi:hypothetical protein
MPRIAPCFLHLVASALLALILSLGLAEAGVYQTPAGGWGIDRPDAPPRDGLRGGSRGL